jgi:hypothetical protein
MSNKAMSIVSENFTFLSDRTKRIKRLKKAESPILGLV